MIKKRWRHRIVDYMSKEWHELTKAGWLTYRVSQLDMQATMCKSLKDSNTSFLEFRRKADAQ